MTNTSDQSSCARSCWFAAALGGVLVALLLMFLAGWGGLGAVLVGILAALIAAYLLTTLLCSSRGDRSNTADDSVAAMVTPGASQTPEPVAEPEIVSTAVTAKATAPVESDEPAFSGLKPSAPLAGQDDLAARKGTWRYEADAETDATTPGKPAGLATARDGNADDIKRIKGIGPKLQRLLNSMGYFHFDQIAAWTSAEIEWVDTNLEGFKGRVTRDNWVGQAKILAAGGETEFSKRNG